MADGLALYRQLKVKLLLDDITLTSFSAALGTSITQLKQVVIRRAGEQNIPKDTLDYKIMVAVREQLKDDHVAMAYHDVP